MVSLFILYTRRRSLQLTSPFTAGRLVVIQLRHAPHAYGDVYTDGEMEYTLDQLFWAFEDPDRSYDSIVDNEIAYAQARYKKMRPALGAKLSV
jgi:hypothetical protein